MDKYKMMLVCFALVFLIAGALLITLSVMDFTENPNMQSSNNSKYGITFAAIVCGIITVCVAISACCICLRSKEQSSF